MAMAVIAVLNMGHEVEQPAPSAIVLTSSTG